MSILGTAFGFATKHWFLTGTAAASSYAYRDEIAEKAKNAFNGVKEDGLEKTVKDTVNTATELVSSAGDTIDGAKQKAEELVGDAGKQLDDLNQLQKDVADLKKVKDDPISWLTGLFTKTNEDTGESEFDLNWMNGTAGAATLGIGGWLLSNMSSGMVSTAILVAIAGTAYAYKDEIMNTLDIDKNPIELTRNTPFNALSDGPS